MTKSLKFLFVVAIVVTGNAAAQSTFQPPYERVLIPISILTPVSGAYGSIWTTDLVGRNPTDSRVDITSNPLRSCVDLCIAIPPQTTFRYSPLAAIPDFGVFVYVGSPGAGQVTFMLRVQDVSRQGQTWGTQIPVVRERNVYTGKLLLLDVPVDSHFRSALRIYDFDDPSMDSPRSVRIRIYDMCGIGPIDNHCSTTPLADTVVALTTPAIQSSNIYPDQPAGAVIGNLVAAFPQLASVPPTTLPFGLFRPATVRIEIDPVTPGARFWAFVSATNNETQHVTTIAPQ